MTNIKKVLFALIDYTGRGQDRFFLSSAGQTQEVTAEAIAEETDELICHDYWLIAPGIFNRAQRLPKRITDIDELRIAISGRRGDREVRDQLDIFRKLNGLADEETIRKYSAVFTRKEPFDEDVLNAIAPALLKFSDMVEEQAKATNEWERYTNIERPVSGYLIESASRGIAISKDRLRAHKEKLDFDYYMALKNFSASYELPLEIPSDKDVIEYLEPRGFDFSGVSLEYVLNFVPMTDNFATDLLNLRSLARSRTILSAIPSNQTRIFPVVDWFGSITSRIYFKDPSLQNLAKRYRDIVIPDDDQCLSYVDFDQFEAGIMAALSEDERLLALYGNGDVYELASEQVFGDRSRRKEAKRLFLSYAYGMKRDNLIAAATSYGANRAAAKEFFRQFVQLERWKSSLWDEFKQSGRIGTSLGNFLLREHEGELSEREKRSAVSQVVQGTASLIFKKALIELNAEPLVQLKIPMHDAALFQHPSGFDTGRVIDIFSRVMSGHLGHRVIGKASLTDFVIDQT